MNISNYKIIRKSNGHDVYDMYDNFLFWVIGSKKSAEVELRKYLKL